MEIKDRLIELMKNERINAALFADTLGVQRSSISHILSGRNKPSLDFLEKILTSYPNYHAEWLIMGKGDMCKQNKPSNLFTAPIPITDDKTTRLDSDKNSPAATESMPKIPIKDTNAPSTDLNEDELASYAVKAAIDSPKNKRIERIVLFYSDGSFSHYHPQ